MNSTTTYTTAGTITALNLEQIIREIATDRLGEFDIPCPVCGPLRQNPANQRRRVLRIWRTAPDFASFHCARCGEKGFCRSTDSAVQKGRESKIAAAIAEPAADLQLRKATWLWQQRQPTTGSPVERYLRQVRGYQGLIPPTIGYLPARDEFPPGMIAAFGLPAEPEPGILQVCAVRGVHVTRLREDGSGKAGTNKDKIMIGRSTGWPIVLAPVSDSLGLTITEGIEDGLSAHEATGLGAWVAGAAGRLLALGAAIPNYVECITIIADDDPAGRKGALELQHELERRGIEVRIVMPSVRGAT